MSASALLKCLLFSFGEQQKRLVTLTQTNLAGEEWKL
jgi:hypothetical protein